MPEREAIRVHTHADRSADRVRISLTVSLPDGVHIEPHQPTDPYLIPTVLQATNLEDVTVTYPEPVTRDLGWNDVALTVLAGRLEFVVTGRVADRVTCVEGTLSFQPCVGGACLPPRTVAWSAPATGATEYSVLDALAASPAYASSSASVSASTSRSSL